jgi:uncharacterized protein (DUF849 family)
MTTPFILAVAPNGARRQKADHPALPLTPAELAREAAACREAGAAMLHLHVRDRDGGHLLDAEAYRTATAAIRAAVGQDMIVQITTEAVGLYTPAQQRAVVRDTAPEAVSLALKEMIPNPGDEGEAAAFYREQAALGVLMQHILYSPEDVRRFRDLRRRGVLPDGRAQVLFVLGRYARDLRSDPADLLPFLEAWGDGDGCGWSICAFGPREAACVGVAAGLGGHGRVGFENNLWRPDGRVAAGNADLVAAARAAADLMGRPLADAGAARELMTP